MSDTDSGTLRTVEVSLGVVEAVADLGGARVSELAEHLDMPPSTVHGHLATLHERSYLAKEGDEYQIGLQFLNRGGHARHRKEGYRLAEEKVERLAERTGERVQFVAEENGRGYYVHTAVGENAVLADARIGKRIYLHDSSAGKSIMAQLPEERVHEIVDRWGLPRFTEHTITDRETLFEELNEVRERGFALNREETHEGLHAVGAAVETHEGQVLGSFSVSGPSNRLKGDRFESEIPDLLRGITNELELRLSYS
jgi:DNA-binding IclR family transcriptional regulator